jgi:hypothetical protein
MSFLTGTNQELIYASTAVGATLSAFTSEVLINTTATMGVQAHLPPDFWLPTPGQVGRTVRIKAAGILSSTATPTYTFTIRTGAAGSTATAIVLGSTAITTISGASNQYWQLEGDVVLNTIGAAGTNSTVRGTGIVQSPGFAAGTQVNPMWGGAASPGTVATVDTSITNFINLNITCSANSASNTITLHQLMVWGLN